MSESKYCRKCESWKPRSSFSPRKQSPDGLRPECRECRNRRQQVAYRESLEENRKAAREYMRKRREDPQFRERQRLNAKKYRESHPQKIKKAEKLRYWENREVSLSKSAKWAKQNPERRRELEKQFRIRDPERYKAIQKKSRQKNKVAVNQRNRARRALKANALGCHTKEEVLDIFKMQFGRCASPWCRKKLGKKYHVDHIVALARGGSNDRKNLQILCPPCNVKKHAKNPLDFARENGMLL